jgi:hypothetical protein
VDLDALAIEISIEQASPKTLMCTADAPDMPAPDSAIVRIMIAASVMPRPEPP